MNLNAVAGPSSLPSKNSLIPHYSSSPSPPPESQLSQSQSQPPPPPRPASPPPLLFLPPPAPQPPKQHLTSTQDLLARFHLLSAYDRYVRPFVALGDDVSLGTELVASSSGGMDPPTGHSGGTSDTLNMKVDKGKGREREGVVGTPGGSGAGEADGADAGDADDDDVQGGKGEKKKKNSYRHLIKNAAGKHSFKKDDYLTTTMLQPPKQRIRIHQFDQRTQQDAFTVSLEGLKGWNIHALIQETPEQKEARKKKKAIKLEKQKAAALGLPPPGSVASRAATPITIQAPIPTAAAAGGVRRMSGAFAGKTAGTPRPGVGTPRPGSTAMATTTSGSSAGTVGTGSVAASRPTSTVPRPASVVPRPGSAVAVPRPGQVVKPPVQAHGQQHLRPGTPMDVDQLQRGKKREREEVNGNGGINGNGVVNGHGNGMVNGNGNGYHHQQPHHQHHQHQHHQQQQQHNGMMQPKPGVVNAKAGTGNIRARPVKKQRMDVQGQARDVSTPVQQQPTPQGV